MSYGKNAPWGLKPSVHLNGTPIVSSDQNEYLIASGTIPEGLFIGDPVVLNGGYIVRATAGAGNAIVGVFAGVKYQDANNNTVLSPYWPANQVTFPIAGGNVPALAYIWDAPDILYDIQTDNSIVGGIIQANIGQNANVVFNTAGSTQSGLSGATLIAPGAGATKQLKIVRLTPAINNQIATRDNNVLVLLNTYYWAANT